MPSAWIVDVLPKGTEPTMCFRVPAIEKSEMLLIGLSLADICRRADLRRRQDVQQRSRLPHVVALCVVDTDLPEEAGGVLVGHELGNGLLAESLGDADNRLDDKLIHGAFDDPSDELAVDLEIVERQRS